MTTKKLKQNLQYNFTQAELLALGKELGESQIRLRQLDDDRKMVADEWKAKISNVEAHIASLSNKTSRQYEYRDMECTATMNDPAPGWKTIRRDDSGEFVQKVVMKAHEMQDELPLEEVVGVSLATALQANAETPVTESGSAIVDDIAAQQAEDAELLRQWNEIRDSDGKIGKVTTSAIQRKLGIGYTQANRILALIEAETKAGAK